jgi:hypothetical protein
MYFGKPNKQPDPRKPLAPQSKEPYKTSDSHHVIGGYPLLDQVFECLNWLNKLSDNNFEQFYIDHDEQFLHRVSSVAHGLALNAFLLSEKQNHSGGKIDYNSLKNPSLGEISTNIKELKIGIDLKYKNDDSEDRISVDSICNHLDRSIKNLNLVGMDQEYLLKNNKSPTVTERWRAKTKAIVYANKALDEEPKSGPASVNLTNALKNLSKYDIDFKAQKPMIDAIKGLPDNKLFQGKLASESPDYFLKAEVLEIDDMPIPYSSPSP